VYREGKFLEDVEGDRNKQGASYVIRIINDDGTIVPPHRHPEDEHITVIQGTWYLGVGEGFDRGVLEEMPIGAYARVPKGMAHFASRGETILGTRYRVVQNRFPRAGDFVRAEQPHFRASRGNGSCHRRALWDRGRGRVRETRLVQYRSKRDEGGTFVALEEDLIPIR
jgi:hypothetical protein